MCYAKDRRELIILRERDPFDHGFGEQWRHAHVFSRQGYHTSVADFHKHDFYEINLILSGNVKILLKDRFEEGCGARLVLTRPDTAHFIACNSDTLYSRIYLVFTDAFIANRFPEWQQLSAVFGKNGTALAISPEEAEEIRAQIERIEQEKNPFGQRLLIYYLLLQILDRHSKSVDHAEAPPYVFDALTYLEQHYAEHINFSHLAERLYVGRTTLMTEFKRHTEITPGEYLTKCRLKNAIRLLLEKQTIESAAEACGFSDSSGLIRAFKRHYKTTPYQYVKSLKR